MFWKNEVIKKFNDVPYKAATKFTWLPKTLDDGTTVFFENYMSIQKLIYPKQDLPLHIEVPEQPFWIELETMELPDVPASIESILEYHLNVFLEDLKLKLKENNNGEKTIE